MLTQFHGVREDEMNNSGTEASLSRVQKKPLLYAYTSKSNINNKIKLYNIYLSDDQLRGFLLILIVTL